MRRAMIEQAVVDRLYSGTWPMVGLVEEVAMSSSVTVQAVYKAIRKLRSEEVVIIHNKQIALSGVWIGKEKGKLEFAEQAYRSAVELQELINSNTGRFKCVFKTLGEIDLYWTHAYFQLAEQVDPSVPTYSIQPHDWYPYVRPETDTYWIKTHHEAGRLSRTLLTHPGALDRIVMRQRKQELGNLFEFTLGENPLQQNSDTYFSLINPYIITARFDPMVATALDSFVNSHNKLPLSASAEQDIRTIIQTKGKFNLTIEKSGVKANRMEQKVRKYFEF
jgi:hypothetical protein